MAVDLPPMRIALYSTLLLFSFILFCLCAARLHYTLNLPPGDPLNGGRDFHDPVVVELLVTSILTMFWSGFIAYVIHRRREPRFIYTFLSELVGIFVLWVMLLGGSAAASEPWGHLNWCHVFEPCRILTALLAFAWLSWIVLTFIFGVTLLFTIANSALREPLHGRWVRDSGDFAPQMSSRA